MGEYVLKSLSQWLLLVAKRLLKKQLEKWFIVPVSESLQVLVIPFLSWDGHVSFIYSVTDVEIFLLFHTT